MLGLADRGRIFDLLELLFGGTPGAALQAFEAIYRDGAEPAQLLADLAEAMHIATRIKAVGADAGSEGLSAEEKRRAGAIAAKLSVPLLARAWQMLLKGIEETDRAPDPRRRRRNGASSASHTRRTCRHQMKSSGRSAEKASRLAVRTFPPVRSRRIAVRR